MKTKPWSDRDKQRLTELAKWGYSSTFSASVMGRTPGAVRQMAIKMKLRFSSLGKRHSQAQKRRWK